MTTHTGSDVRRTSDRQLVDLPEVWGTVSIAFMWLAVLAVGVWGGDVVSADLTRIPSAVFVALFACIGTAFVARRAFGHHTD